MWRIFTAPKRAKAIENKRLILAVLLHARREKFKMYRHFHRGKIFLFFIFFHSFFLSLFFFNRTVFGHWWYIIWIYDFHYVNFLSIEFYSIPWDGYASSFPNKAIQKEVMNIRNCPICLSIGKLFIIIILHLFSSPPKSFCALPHYCIWIINISTSFSTINGFQNYPPLYPLTPPTTPSHAISCRSC